MATPDRILQLKLVSDTKGVSKDLKTTTTSLTKVQKAQSKMQAGWKRMGPAIKTGFTAALDLGVDALKRGFAEFEEGEKVSRDLERVLDNLGRNSARNLDLIAKAADHALDLNFDDEDFKRSVGLVEQHFNVSIPKAIDTVNASMDVAAQMFDGDLPRALRTVEAALRGKKKAFEQLGIPMRLLGHRAQTLRWILHHFAGAAEGDANTLTGKWGAAQKRLDNILGDLVGTLVTNGLQIADAFSVMWNALTGDDPEAKKAALGDVLGFAITQTAAVAVGFEQTQNRVTTATNDMWAGVSTAYDVAQTGLAAKALSIGVGIYNAITGKTSKVPGSVGGDLDALELALEQHTEGIRAAAAAIGAAIANPIVQRVTEGRREAARQLELLQARLTAFHIPLLGPLISNPYGQPPRNLAEGGIVDRPTLAVIGERGPEAVVPLGSGGGMPWGGVVINITTGVGDPVEIGRQVDRVLRAYRGRAGLAA